MTNAELEKKFDDFMDWPSESKQYVTSTSGKVWF